MSGPKLLLADDSLTIQRVIGLTFANENVQVIAVPDGDEAITRIAVERPDIVLADIGMPKRSGYDVAAFVKSDPSLAHIPVVLLAGAFEPVDDARARQAGSDGVLVKPFEPQHVIARVRELLARAKPPQASPPLPAVALREPAVQSLPAGELATLAPPFPPADATPAVPLDLSLDDYFDRLDAAFAELETGAAAGASEATTKAPADAREEMVDGAPVIPTLDELLSGLDPGATESEDVRAAFSQPEVSDVSLDPLDALDLNLSSLDAAPLAAPLPAVEEMPIEPAAPPPSAPHDISVDELANRVMERLQQQAGGNLHDLVANVVSQVAERLIREEIDRIRRQ